jgi:exopolyphosphatase / guanosine-5'-triphosphate,3'-diphosphate pyrophosphatase
MRIGSFYVWEISAVCDPRFDAGLRYNRGAMMLTNQPLRIGVIDLGSNTARLIVMSSIPGYAYRQVDEIREVTRLREGMTAGGLSETAVARAFSTLKLFKRYCDSSQVNDIIATTTSAVREAANGAAFVQQVEREIGLSLQILDGDREAYYAAIGALNEVAFGEGFVVDIGGGSAQISDVSQRRFARGCSMSLGALALTERFVRHDPATPAEIKALQKEIAGQLTAVSWLQPHDGLLVGLGGAIRNLARIEAARQNYPLNTLHGFRLSRDAIAQSIDQFCQLPLAERQKISGLSADRADIILAGALVIQAIMEYLAFDQLTVAVNGLREGLFLEQFWQHLSYPVIGDPRRFSVLNLARIYQYQKNHANHVRYLVGRLFDQLAPLHGFGPAERELLTAAALLHDLGSVISYDSHHKHSEMLVIHNGLSGFTPREIALIALLARYHRKGAPDTAVYKLLMRAEDERRLLQLSAILRLAEFLERARNATVDDVLINWDDGALHLTLIAEEYPAVELWDSDRNAVPLMAEAFGRPVILESAAPPGDWRL